MTTTVGEHDPIELSHPRLGNWIECECGWISSGFTMPADARRAHKSHTARTETEKPDA